LRFETEEPMSKPSFSPAVPENAEAIGLAALVFLTEDGDRLGRFLGETGMSPADLGQAAGAPEMLAAVLDHLLQDESLLMVFAASAGIEPAEIAPARIALVGANGDFSEYGYGEAAQKQVKTASRKVSRRWSGPDAE
jgi:hypothetical protein